MRARVALGASVRPLNSDVRLAQLIPVLLLLAALLPSLISGVYFFTSPKSSPVTLRLFGSMHGVSISALYALCAGLVAAHATSDFAQRGILCSLLLPLILMWVSFELYDGPKMMHFLHLINVVSLAILAVLVIMVPAFP